MEERSELVDPTYIEICKNAGREWILAVGDSAIGSYMSGWVLRESLREVHLKESLTSTWRVMHSSFTFGNRYAQNVGESFPSYKLTHVSQSIINTARSPQICYHYILSGLLSAEVLRCSSWFIFVFCRSLLWRKQSWSRNDHINLHHLCIQTSETYHI